MMRKLIRLCTASPKRLLITVVSVVLAGLLIVVVILRSAADHTPAIIITSEQLQQELNHKNTFYKSQHNTINQQTLRADTIQQLARDRLIQDYAKAHTITTTENEIDAIYQQRAKVSGGEQKLLTKLSRLYGTNEQQYRATIALDILKSKVQSTLHTPLNTWLTQQLSHYRIVVQ